MKEVQKHYSYSVFWSEEDQEYVATCPDFPSLSWLDSDPVRALKGFRKLLAEAL